MKLFSLKFRILLAVLLLAVTIGTAANAFAAEQEKTFLITPFQINSEEPLDFLKKGIDKMLDTRLTEQGRSRVVFAPDVETGSGFDADYIIDGTILIFGAQVSTDVKLINADTGMVELSFDETGSKKGDVIKHVDLFADSVRTRILGLSPVAGPATSVPTTATAPAAQAFNQGPAMLSSQVIWRGPFLKKTIDSLQVQDIDNDGKDEILILAENVLEIYRREGGRLMPISKNKIDEINVRCYFLDAIDLDKDGRKEICVTGVNESQLRAASSIYRLENGELVKLLGPVNYLFRVVDAATGPMLLGQKTLGDDSRKLKTPVVELEFGQGGQSLVPAGKSFSFADNVFGLAFGDFMNNGEEIAAVLDLKGIISLYSQEGRELYRSSDEYGGSAAYIEYKGMRYNKDDGFQLDRIFFQQRIFAADVNGDGKTGLVVVKNSDTARGLLTSTRFYRKSHIDELLWNELGFIVLDKGQNVSGYISDFSLGDTNADGKTEVVFSVVSPAKILKDSRSQIFSKQRS
ncbi:hypothetical protein DSCO28_49980 [Desulfosarcina ovata subsp. sediminis]|uniref:VCBS repeat-containing protein n=2 Tax=Desulfosarcina ovata TaxID=83564 RepID=A0A5K7ZW03_9BACT|nr:hypothetical protein DSCO28_49980 [Desulfosarcina ovata subsp. sediminis]